MEIYEYDEEKDQANIKKHGVSFDEAITVFQDSNLKITCNNYPFEERFNVIGRSALGRQLLVVHCYREKSHEEVIRIISARRLTPTERRRLGGL